jgi:hypothetical protein
LQPPLLPLLRQQERHGELRQQERHGELRQQERHGEGAWSKCPQLRCLDRQLRQVVLIGIGAPGSTWLGTTEGQRMFLLPQLQHWRLQKRPRHPPLHPLLLLLPLCLGAPGALVGFCLFDENDQQQQQGHQHLAQHQQDPQQQQQDNQQQWQQQEVKLVLWDSLLSTPLRCLQQQQQQRTLLMRPLSTSPHPGETSPCVR